MLGNSARTHRQRHFLLCSPTFSLDLSCTLLCLQSAVAVAQRWSVASIQNRLSRTDVSRWLNLSAPVDTTSVREGNQIVAPSRVTKLV
jgi:hypothetical protein